MNCKKLLYTTIAVAALTSTGCNTTPVTKNDRMDLTVKPGDNFYQYASGNWIANLPEKPEFSRYNQFDILGEVNDNRILDIITHASNGNPAQGSIEQKISDYYALCMDSTRRNQEGVSPVKPILDEIQKTATRPLLVEQCGRLQKKGIGGLFVGAWLQGDIMNATENIVTLYQGGTQLNRDYYLNDTPKNVKIREAYTEYVKNLFQLAGYADADAKAQAVLRIETQIAQGNYDKVKLREPQDNYHKTTIQELKKQYPKVDWLKFFAVQGYQDFQYLNVAQPEAIDNVTNIIASDPLDDLKSYVQFKVLNTSAPLLSDDFGNEVFAFNKVLNRNMSPNRPNKLYSI